MLAATTINAMLRPESGCSALYAAGGTTSSEGNGINELSIAIRSAMDQ